MNESSPFIPVTFAVTDELKQDYDWLTTEVCLSIQWRKITWWGEEEKDENKLEEYRQSSSEGNEPRPTKWVNWRS
jgi:hypothetical protein